MAIKETPQEKEERYNEYYELMNDTVKKISKTLDMNLEMKITKKYDKNRYVLYKNGKFIIEYESWARMAYSMRTIMLLFDIKED